MNLMTAELLTIRDAKFVYSNVLHNYVPDLELVLTALPLT